VRGPPGQARTTVLVGLLLVLLLVAAYAVVSAVGRPPEPPRHADPPTVGPVNPPVVGAQTSPADPPRPGAGYPVRTVGTLEDDRSVLVDGRGNAELRYRRAPHNGTRLHVICTGTTPAPGSSSSPAVSRSTGERCATRPT
jgi:hypothetical protein